MGISLLYEIQTEIREAYIAGCETIAGNSRLKKLLPKIREAGSSIPVFGRIADTLDRVTNYGENIPENVLELANLTNAVLYTQGQTTIDGELEAIKPAGLVTSTKLTLSCLMPVLKELYNGNGESDILEEAHKAGFFSDFRLVYRLLSSLDQCCYKIEEKVKDILREMGPSIVEIIKKSLHQRSSSGAMHCIELISDISGGKEKELYLYIIEECESGVKAAAIRALKDCPECEDLLLELSRDKNSRYFDDVLYALAHIGTDNAVKLLYEEFSRGNLDVPINFCTSKEMIRLLVYDGEKLLEDIVALSEKLSSQTNEYDERQWKEKLKKFTYILGFLDGKKDPEILQFLKKCLEHTEYLLKFGKHRIIRFLLHSFYRRNKFTIVEMAAESIMVFDSPEVMEYMESYGKKFNNELLAYSFEAAVRHRDPAYVFDHYSEYVMRGKKTDECRMILNVMYQFIKFKPQYRFDDDDNYKNPRITGIDNTDIKWDQRWLEVFKEIHEFGLICRLITSGDSELCDYLMSVYYDRKKRGGARVEVAITDIFRGLLQAEYPDIKKAIDVSIEFYNEYKSPYGGLISAYTILRIFELLPKDYAGYLRKHACMYEDEDFAVKLYELSLKLEGKK